MFSYSLRANFSIESSHDPLKVAECAEYIAESKQLFWFPSSVPSFCEPPVYDHINAFAMLVP
jgi:hypothetical protein